MERTATAYKGYNEIVTEHYAKWEKAQSERYFEYRKKWEESGKKLIEEKFPLHLDIGITNICNLECTFCARTHLVKDGRFRDAKNMDMGLYKKIIDEAVELGTYSINLNLLNEPLINPNLVEMIKYAKQKGIIDVHFHSHGGLLTEKKANELLESGLDKLLISIDTPSKEKYEKIRVLSKFDDVVTNLKRFKELRDERKLLNPLIKSNFIQFRDITKDEIERNIEFGLSLSDCVGLQEFVDPTFTIGKDKKYSEDYKSSFVCQQPFTRLSIIEDGRVSPCCLDHQTEMIIGDLTSQTILEVWNSEKMKEFRTIQKNGRFFEVSTCKNCEVAINGDEGINTPYEKFGPTL